VRGLLRDRFCGARRCDSARLRLCESAAAKARRPRPAASSLCRKALTIFRANRAASMPSCGSPIRRKRFGIVSTVNRTPRSSGTYMPVKSAEIGSGVGPHQNTPSNGRASFGLLLLVGGRDTPVPLSFHHFARGQGGRGDVRLLATARAPRDAPRRIVSADKSARTCIPRDPLVFGHPRRPISSRRDFTSERDRADVRPTDPGTRIEIDPSTRSDDRDRRSAQDAGAARCIQGSQSTQSRSVIDDRFSSAVRPDGNASVGRSQPRGALRRCARF